MRTIHPRGTGPRVLETVGMRGALHVGSIHYMSEPALCLYMSRTHAADGPAAPHCAWAVDIVLSDVRWWSEKRRSDASRPTSTQQIVGFPLPPSVDRLKRSRGVQAARYSAASISHRIADGIAALFPKNPSSRHDTCR